MTRRVLITGTFDVANYGDLLFPLVAQWRLPETQVIAVSPTAGPTCFADAQTPVAIADMLGGARPADAILIGGGYIIHDQTAGFLDEYRAANAVAWAYPALWLGATLLGALYDMPVLWNAPGAPFPFARSRRETLIAPVLQAADYVAVRDPGSAEFLGSRDGATIAIVPDTVADLARMWPRTKLEAPFRHMLARKQAIGGSRFMSIHLRDRSLAGLPVDVLAGWIDQFAMEHGFTPILLAIGPSLHDDVAARDVSARLRVDHVLLDDPASLAEIAAAIAHSVLYIGASMHGYVTAAAYDVPGILVAYPAHRKYGGFVDAIDRRRDLVRDWHQAFTTASLRLAEKPARCIPASAHTALDRHWQRIRDTIGQRDHKRAERRDFLSRFRSDGPLADPASVFLPFLGHRQKPGPASAPGPAAFPVSENTRR